MRNADLLLSDRGEFVGDGIARTAGGLPYNPNAGQYRFEDDEFWNARQSLHEILRYAESKLVSPYAVLAGVLARVVTATPPHIVLPQYVGAGYGSLNFGVAILGGPGSGKDTAFDTAGFLVPDIRGAAVCGAATGQAVSALFGRREGSDGVYRTVCNNPRAMLRYSEALNFRSLSSNRENNLKPVLLSLFSGQQIGDYTKNQELALVVPAHGYRAIPVFSAQPSMMGVFEEGVGEGFQQRFLYVSAFSDRIADMPIPCEAAGSPELTIYPYSTEALPSDYSPVMLNRLYEYGGYASANKDLSDEEQLKPQPMVFPERVRLEIVAERIMINVRKEVDPKKAHGNYLRMKLAAAFCLLEYPRRRSLTVDEDDWMLAGHLQQYSRDCYGSNLKEYMRQKCKRRADGKEEDELAREEVDNRAQQSTERRVIEVLTDSESSSGVSRREIFQKLSKRQRNYLEDALGNLMTSNRIRRKRGRQDGEWYMLS